MDEHVVADEVCELVGATSLLAWLDLPDDVDGARAVEALQARRRKLQSLQGSAKHRHVARLVIQKYRSLQRVLEQPGDYLTALRRRQALAKLPLLDIGVDGVLADGAVNEEELDFLYDTARRLGLDPQMALGRLKLRAQVHGVSLKPPPPASTKPVLLGPSHPLLSRRWLDEAVGAWMSGLMPDGVRTVVEPVAGEGAVAVTLLGSRPRLTYLGFSVDEDVADRVQEAFERHDLDRASVLPSASHALPLSAATADVAWFVLHAPTPDEVAEAWRVVGSEGQVWVVSAGPPRVTLGGPVPALDGALWGLCRAAGLTPSTLPARAASTHVVTRTVVGPRDELVAMLLQRVAAVQAHAALADEHPAVRRIGHALEELRRAPGDVGCYEVPLQARHLARP